MMGIKKRKPEKPKEPSDNLGRPFQLIINTILIFLASQFIAALLVELVLGLIYSGSADHLNNSIAAQFFFVLIAEGLAFYIVLRLVRNRGVGLKFIGLGRKPNRKDLFGAAIGFAAFYGLLIIAGIIIDMISPNITSQSQNIGFNNINSAMDNVLAVIALVILPPLGEETLVRGYLYSGLRRFWRFWPALLVTSLLFGIAHLEFGSGTGLVWGAGIDTFILSVVLVYLREHTGALYAGMAVHMLNNLIAFNVHFK